MDVGTVTRPVANPIPFRGSPMGLVRAWHEKFGQQVRERPDASATDAEVEYRDHLHREEIDELLEAMRARDVVAIADAIADALYVLYGTGLSYGIDVDLVMAEVHRSNMTKTHDPSRAKYEGKVVVKGEDYEPPQIARVLGLAASAEAQENRGGPSCDPVVDEAVLTGGRAPVSPRAAAGAAKPEMTRWERRQIDGMAGR